MCVCFGSIKLYKWLFDCQIMNLFYFRYYTSAVKLIKKKKQLCGCFLCSFYVLAEHTNGHLFAFHIVDNYETSLHFF